MGPPATVASPRAVDPPLNETVLENEASATAASGGGNEGESDDEVLFVGSSRALRRSRRKKVKQEPTADTEVRCSQELEYQENLPKSSFFVHLQIKISFIGNYNIFFSTGKPLGRGRWYDRQAGAGHGRRQRLGPATVAHSAANNGCRRRHSGGR